jgi:hypothetical protein
MRRRAGLHRAGLSTQKRHSRKESLVALSYNLSKIADFETVCLTKPDAEGNRHLRSVTNHLIWATMIIDIGEIKASNIGEWLFRLTAMARIYQDDTHAKVTREMLEQHIGLSTNVSNKTRAAFLKDAAKRLERECERAVRESKMDAQPDLTQVD